MENLSTGAWVGLGIFYIALIVFMVITGWKIFEKAGKPGWAVIVPIYNIIVFLEIIEKPWWWLLLLLIPYVNLIWAIWATNLLSKKFGKDVGFTIGLLLLGIVFYPILAFGDAKYEGASEDDQMLYA